MSDQPAHGVPTRNQSLTLETLATVYEKQHSLTQHILTLDRTHRKRIAHLEARVDALETGSHTNTSTTRLLTLATIALVVAATALLLSAIVMLIKG